ncbi:MAG TPA: (d)CMP kinase [Anaerolineaceae bacterium]
MKPQPSIITIDGPAASGKSTIGEMLANHLGYLYFDTGVMYRAVTWAALNAFGAVQDEELVSKLVEEIKIDVNQPSQCDGRKCDVLVDGVDVTWEIRNPEVDANVSQVSAYPAVRRELTRQQRRIGQRGSVVMVGRDIGTVVLPEAPLKIYLDASVEERARRRYREEIARGMESSYEKVLELVKKRDLIDSNRALAPLVPAHDAKFLWTDGMETEEVYRKVLEWVEE